ncbi:MAG TPA: hypothetical protein VKU44_05590 [Terriglobia bacterium]|nr:hypothetical protein [Terriglobia bacterium]
MKKKLRWMLVWCALVAGTAALTAAQEPDAQPADAGDNPSEITIPEGTEFKLQLHSTINSRTSKVGDRVMSTMLDPVDVEDQDVLPKGLRVDGHVGEVKAAAHRGKGGFLTIVFDTVELPNGEKLAIQGSLTEVFSNAGAGGTNVGAEGELKGGGPNRAKQAAMVIVPASAGAAGGIAGGIAGGVTGIMAAYLLPKGKEASLAAGSLIGMRLDRDVTLTPSPQTPPPPAADGKSQ